MFTPDGTGVGDTLSGAPHRGEGLTEGVAPLLEVRLFGPPLVRVAGEPLAPLKSRRGVQALALLALRAGREVERLWLAGTLWPDSPDETALANLRRTLTELRAALGPQASALIEAPTSRSLRLRPDDALFCDVAAFEAALRRGDRAAALGLYAGPLCEGWETPWVAEERERRAQGFLAAAEAHAAALLAGGDFAGAAAAARRAAAADPLREASWRLLMEALAKGGNPAAATEAFRDLRTLLRREVGTEPDAATLALYRSLHVFAAPTSPVAAAVAPPRLPAAPEPAGRLVAPPSLHLPAYLTGFVGRAEERAEVARLFRESGARLVTLAGPGGVGKTRLAVEAVRGLAASPGFAAWAPDGAWFVDLAAHADPGRVAQAVAAALQAGEAEGAEGAEDRLLRWAAQRRLIVVLDNCEHLIDACARLAARLLARCPGVRILATSRQALGITGEATRRVEPLPVAGGAAGDLESGGEAAAGDATRLFVERARAARPDFAPVGRQAEVVRRVCRRLDGIPLAIELAAARLRALSIEDIDRRLADRFKLLTGGDRAALPRQQTLRALIDWSHGLLAEKERLLLARLGAFAGGWTLEDAERICADGSELEEWEVMDLLTGLVDKSMAAFDDPGTGTARYRLLETIREYVREQSDADPDLRDRHLARFAEISDDCAENLGGNTEPARAAAQAAHIEADSANMRAAWEWARERSDWERLLLLPLGPGRLALRTGRFGDVVDWMEDSLRLAGERTTARTRARASHIAGCLGIVRGDLRAAVRHFETALAGFRERDKPVWIGIELINLAILARDMGDPARAKELFSEGVEIQRRMASEGVPGAESAMGNALTGLARAHRLLGENGEAYAGIDESIAVLRGTGSQLDLAHAHVTRGYFLRRDGRFGEAEADLRQALAVARGAGGGMHPEQAALVQLAHLLLLSGGGLAEAHSSLVQVRRLLQETGAKAGVPEFLLAVARLVARAGAGEKEQAALAVRLVSAALAIEGASGQVPDRTDSAADLAELRAALGDAAYGGAWREGELLSADAALSLADGVLAFGAHPPAEPSAFATAAPGAAAPPAGVAGR